MNIKVPYLPYFECVYHSLMIETFSNVNTCMVPMVHSSTYYGCRYKVILVPKKITFPFGCSRIT